MKKTVLSICLLVSAASFAQQRVAVGYRICTDRAEQTILHFGASDGWSMRYIGLWPERLQRQLAQWLFSSQNDAHGQPLGIGLSLWRFNLGAGSAEQGDSSQISPDTRTECFLNADGTYDWTRQRGQRNFLHEAQRMGVKSFLAFMNSVPVMYTANGLATNTGRDATMNIQPDKFKDVAKFTARVMKGLEYSDSIHFDYISPVNEPDGSWNWLGPKQEGSPATNREVSLLVKAMSREFKKNKISTRITIDESSDIRCLLGIHSTDWQRGYGIRDFFGKDSTQTYLGNVSSVLPAVLAHSYWTDTPVDSMKAVRLRLRDELSRRNLGYWESELCIMSNDNEIGGGGYFDFSMRTALYVARVMHYDLVYGNAQSWSWWRAVGGDYKDGLLRAFSEDNLKTGFVVPSRLMWAMGNYSRFIRPGAVRYDVEALDASGNILPDGETQPYSVMVSAYKNRDGSWVVVAINYSEGFRNFALQAPLQDSWEMYRTSDVEGETLKPVGIMNGTTRLQPKSITTFVLK